MPTLLSARSRRGAGVEGADAGAAAAAGGNRACYIITACAVSMLLFCALAASVSVWMAFTFGALALVAFGVAGFLAGGPVPSNGGDGDGATSAAAGREAADADDGAAAAAPRTQQRRRQLGLPKAAINALPTFAYEPSVAGAGARDLESGTTTTMAGGGETCSVCLEDVEAGEMVRQLPACRHLFHVECIDMWLHSHRTCPVCRCNLLPSPRNAGAKAAAPAPAPDATEQPADDEALPPV